MSGTHMQQLRRAGSHSSTDADAEDQSLRQRWRKDTAVPVEHPSCSLPSLSRRVDAPPGTITAECAAEANPVGFPAVQSNSSLRLLVSGDQRDASQQHALMEIHSNSNSNSGKSPDDASLPHVANSPSNTDVAPALPFSPLPHLDENGGSPRTHATNAPLDALPDAHSADPTATHPSPCATAATSVADEVAHNDTRTYPISSVKTPATTTELTSSCGDDFDDVSQHRQRTMEGDAGTATPSQVMMADGRHATSEPEIISAHPLAPPEDAHVPHTTSSQHDTPFTAVPRTAGGNATTSSAHISPGGVPQQVIDSFASVDVTTPSVSNKYYSTLIPSGYHRFHQQHDEVLVRVESELDHSVPPSVLEERLPANISMDDDDNDDNDDNADVPTQVHQGTAKENISTNAASDDDGEPTIATDIVADHDLSDEAPAALQLESSAVDEFARVNVNGSNDSHNAAIESNNSITRTYHRPATSDEVPSLPGSTKRVQPSIPAEATHNEANNNNNNNTQDSDSRPSTSGMPNISSESAVSAAIREATTRNRQTLNTRISNNNSISNNNNNNQAVRGPLRESDSFPPVSEYTPSISRNYNFSTLVPSAQPNRAQDDVVVGGSATHFPQDVLPQPNGGDDDERPIPMAPLFSEGAFHDSSTQQELSIPVEVTDLSNIRFSNSNTTSNTSPELRRTSSPSHPMPNIASVSAVSAMMHEDDEVEPPTTTNINIDVTRNNHNPHRVMGFIEAESESFPPMAESGASNSHNYYTHLRAPRTPQDYVEHDAEPHKDVEISQAVVPPENTADAPVPSPPSRDQLKREVSEVMHDTSEDAHKVDAPSPPLDPHPTSSPPSPSSAAIRNASPRNNIDGIPRMGIADASESFPPTSANASTTSQPYNPSKRPSLVERLALLEMRNTTTPDSAAINFTSVDVSSAKPTSPSSPAAVVVVPVDDDDATYNADPLNDDVGDDGEAAHGAAVDAVSDDENRSDAQYLCEEQIPEGEAQPMEEMHEHTDITDSVEHVDASMEQHEAPPSPSPQSSVQQDIVAEEDSVHAMSTPPPERPSTAEVPAPAHTPPVEDAAIKMDAAPPPSVATVPHPPEESAVEAAEAPQDVPERRRRRRHHHRHRHSSRQEEEVHPEPQQPTTASEPPPPAPTPPTTPAPEVQPRRVELSVLETMKDDAEEAHSPVEEAEASASTSSVSSSANAPDPLRATIRSPPPVADDDEPAALPPIKPQKKPAKPHDDDRPQPRRRQKKLAPLAKRGRKVQVPPEEEPTAHPPSPRNDSSPSGGRVRRNEEAGTPHRRKRSSPNRWKRRMNFSFDERLDDDPYRFNHPIDAPPRPEQKPPIPAPSAATCSWHVDKQKQLCIMEPMTFSVDDHPLPLHGRLLMRSSTKEEFSSSRPSSKRKARKDDGPSERSSHLPSKSTSFSDHPRASTSHSRRRDGAQKRHKHKKKNRLPRVRGTDKSGSHDLLGYYWPYIDPSTRQQLMKNTSLSQSEKESYVRSCTSDMFLLKELNAC